MAIHINDLENIGPSATYLGTARSTRDKASYITKRERNIRRRYLKVRGDRTILAELSSLATPYAPYRSRRLVKGDGGLQATQSPLPAVVEKLLAAESGVPNPERTSIPPSDLDKRVVHLHPPRVPRYPYPCKYFSQKPGSCPFGETCYFTHFLPSELEGFYEPTFVPYDKLCQSSATRPASGANVDNPQESLGVSASLMGDGSMPSIATQLPPGAHPLLYSASYSDSSTFPVISAYQDGNSSENPIPGTKISSTSTPSIVYDRLDDESLALDPLLPNLPWAASPEHLHGSNLIPSEMHDELSRFITIILPAPNIAEVLSNPEQRINVINRSILRSPGRWDSY